MKINRLGAIDIGSNSVKLLIMDVINHEGKVVYKTSSFTRVPLRLGEETFSLGYIPETRVEKLAELIGTFVSLMQINDVERWQICATSVLREAKNANSIVDYVLKKTGCGIKIISPSEEAYYIGLNLIQESLENDKIYVVADVGGGCTEISLFKKNEQPVYNTFNLGTIRLLSAEENLKEWAEFSDWVNKYRNGHRHLALIGSGGNINKLNSIFNKRGKIKKYDFSNYYKRLSSTNLNERVLNFNLGLNRAEVLLPAMKIYLQIMKILKTDEIEIPVIGLADGIIKDIYLKEYLNQF